MLPHLLWSLSVSENKALCHPSSVDSLSTSAATEDHVSMGGWAARKALRVIEHVEQGKAGSWEVDLTGKLAFWVFLRMESPPTESVFFRNSLEVQCAGPPAPPRNTREKRGV